METNTCLKIETLERENRELKKFEAAEHQIRIQQLQIHSYVQNLKRAQQAPNAAAAAATSAATNKATEGKRNRYLSTNHISHTDAHISSHTTSTQQTRAAVSTGHAAAGMTVNDHYAQPAIVSPRPQHHSQQQHNTSSLHLPMSQTFSSAVASPVSASATKRIATRTTSTTAMSSAWPKLTTAQLGITAASARHVSPQQPLFLWRKISNASTDNLTAATPAASSSLPQSSPIRGSALSGVFPSSAGGAHEEGVSSNDQLFSGTAWQAAIKQLVWPNKVAQHLKGTADAITIIYQVSMHVHVKLSEEQTANQNCGFE